MMSAAKSRGKRIVARRSLKKTATALAVIALFGSAYASDTAVETVFSPALANPTAVSPIFSLNETIEADSLQTPSVSPGSFPNLFTATNRIAAGESFPVTDLNLSFRLVGPTADTPEFYTSGGTLLIDDGALLTLEGSTADISFAAENTAGVTRNTLSGAVFVGFDESSTDSAGIVFSAERSTISAEVRAPNSGDAAGLILGRGASSEFKSGTTLISASTDAEMRPPQREPGWDGDLPEGDDVTLLPRVVGLLADQGSSSILLEESASLTIKAESLGTRQNLAPLRFIEDGSGWGAADAVGLVIEGGSAVLKGSAEIEASAAGGAAYGAILRPEALNASSVGSSADHGLSVEINDLTIKAESDNSMAVGLLLAGTRLNGSASQSIYGKTELHSYGTLNIDAQSVPYSGENDGTRNLRSAGIIFNATDNPGAKVYLHGNTTINADNALTVRGGNPLSKAPQFYVENHGDLVLNGTVSGYTGTFYQKSGSTVINDSPKFFGGSVYVERGTLKTDAEFIYNDDIGGDSSLSFSGLYIGHGTAELGSISILHQNDGSKDKYVVLHYDDSELILNNGMYLAEDTGFGSRAGTLTVRGGDTIINGRFGFGYDHFIGIPGKEQPVPEQSEMKMIVESGAVTIGAGGFIRVRDLILAEGIDCSVGGTEESSGFLTFKTLNIGAGSTVTVSEYGIISLPEEEVFIKDAVILNKGYIGNVRKSENNPDDVNPLAINISGGTLIHQAGGLINADSLSLSNNAQLESGGDARFLGDAGLTLSGSSLSLLEGGAFRSNSLNQIWSFTDSQAVINGLVERAMIAEDDSVTSSLELHVSGGSLNVGSTGEVLLNNLILSNGAEARVAGRLQSDRIELNSGASLTGGELLYLKNVTLNEDTRLGLNIESGDNTTFTFSEQVFAFNGGRFLNAMTDSDYLNWNLTNNTKIDVLSGSYTVDNLFVSENSSVKLTGGGLVVQNMPVHGTVSVSNSTLEVDNIILEGQKGRIQILENGKLITGSQMMFENALNSEASITDPGSFLFADNDQITFADGSTLVINDPQYNLRYAEKAAKLFGASDTRQILFSGSIVGNTEDDGSVDIGELPGDGSVHDNLLLRVVVPNGEYYGTVDKNLGASRVKVVGELLTQTVGSLYITDSLTLTGTQNETDELVLYETGPDRDGLVSVRNGGKLTLGAVGSENNHGSLTSRVEIESDSELHVAEGSFHASKISVNGHGTLTAAGGSLAVSSLEVTGNVTVSENGELSFSSLSIDPEGRILVDGGRLVTGSTVMFLNSLGEEGLVTEAGGYRFADNANITFDNGGTLVINDAKYNLLYAEDAARLFGASESKRLLFTGELVEVEPDDGSIDLHSLASDSIVHDGTIAKLTLGEGETEGIVDINVGVSRLLVEGPDAKAVSVQSDFILTGGKTNDVEVISFVGQEAGFGSVTVQNGTLTLGWDGSQNNHGRLSAETTVGANGILRTAAGEFALKDVSVLKGGVLEVQAGQLTAESLTLDGGLLVTGSGGIFSADSIRLGSSAELDLGKPLTVPVLSVGRSEGASHLLTGSLTVKDLAVDDGTNSEIRVGKSDADAEGTKLRGDLTILSGSLKGLSVFVDPPIDEADGLNSASRFTYAQNLIEGNVTVSQNAYAVLGTTDDSPFTALVSDGVFSWGKTGDAVSSALYLGAPVRVSSDGSITVDSSARAGTRGAGGSVTFAEGTLLAADVALSDGTPLITADSFRIADSARAVLIGAEIGKTYRLTGYNEGITPSENDTLFSAGNISSATSLICFTVNADGSISTSQYDAGNVYGGLLQSVSIADAALKAGNSWAQGILEEEYLNGLAQTAAQFDAALNPASALITATTAYDRTREMRSIVRSEAGLGKAKHVWARATGSLTDYDSIATGAQSLSVETDSAGVVFGFESKLRKEEVRVGAALSVGKGTSENKSVRAKDKFTYIGADVYTRTALGGIGITADASLLYMKSDLTVGGVSAVDTDTETGVASAGVSLQKSFMAGPVFITPFAGVEASYVRTKGYSNGHGAHVDAADAYRVDFPLGIKTAAPFMTDTGTWMTPEAWLTYTPGTPGDLSSTVSFEGASDKFVQDLAGSGQLRLGLGLSGQKKNLIWGLTAEFEHGSMDHQSYNISGRLKYAF